MNFALSNHTIEKYFGFLFKLDKKSKQNLIDRLSASMNKKEPKHKDFQLLHGAWDDDRTSDEIILEIRKARAEKTDFIGF
jgi:hypothetical protein